MHYGPSGPAPQPWPACSREKAQARMHEIAKSALPLCWRRKHSSVCLRLPGLSYRCKHGALWGPSALQLAANLGSSWVPTVNAVHGQEADTSKRSAA